MNYFSGAKLVFSIIICDVFDNATGSTFYWISIHRLPQLPALACCKPLEFLVKSDMMTQMLTDTKFK